jgi:hypothetical protein
VANKGYGADGTHTIQDKLWLPTVREMFGDNRRYTNDTYETAANQARLEYYTSDAVRMKYDADNSRMWYWLASPYSASAADFCNVNHTGITGSYDASSVGGCAPAFCVR